MEVSDTGLNQIARVLGALADGDLTQTVSMDFQGTFGELKDDANATVQKLTQIVVELQEVAAAIANTSGSGNSSGVGNAASRMEETAESLKQLTTTVKHNADGAARATELANSARVLAIEGGTVAA